MSRRRKFANGQMQEKKIVNVTSLKQMGTQTVTVVIERGDEELRIPFKTLTYGEWFEIGKRVIDPPPPVTGAGPAGKVYDFQDPDWRRLKQESNERRGLLRLLAALEVDDITGDTDDAKIDCLLARMDTQVIHALMSVLEDIHLDKEARIETRANSFQPA